MCVCVWGGPTELLFPHATMPTDKSRSDTRQPPLPRQGPTFERLRSGGVLKQANCSRCSAHSLNLPPVCQVTNSPRTQTRQSFSSLKKKKKKPADFPFPAVVWVGQGLSGGRVCLKQVAPFP